MDIKHKLKKVCAAIDAQGYTIDGDFYPKEVAIRSHNFQMSVLCDVDQFKMKDLSRQDYKTAEWTYNYMGIPLESKDHYYRRFAPQAQVFRGAETILAAYKFVRTDAQPMVVIKNKQLIPILVMWDIPFVEFPEFSVPEDNYLTKLVGNYTCMHHSLSMTKCAVAKVDALWAMCVMKLV